mgnify:CR=1 FL=1
MKKSVVNILIASVGGQGGLTLSRILVEAAVLAGFSARTGETLGMAQRYGSVVSYVRIGEHVLAPLFSPGEAHFLLGLEILEALRNIHYLSPNGLAIVADEYRPSFAASFNQPHTSTRELILKLKSIKPSAIIVPARKIAMETGNPRALNMVILGALSAVFDIVSKDTLVKAIERVLPARFVESSLRAFEKGYSYVKSQQAL